MRKDSLDQSGCVLSQRQFMYYLENCEYFSFPMTNTFRSAGMESRKPLQYNVHSALNYKANRRDRQKEWDSAIWNDSHQCSDRFSESCGGSGT